MVGLDLTADYDKTTIKGSTALVTGGASGIGAAIAQKYAELGANVIIADLNQIVGEATVAALRSTSGNENHHFVSCDVSNWDSISAAFTTALSLSPNGHLNHVVANAGIGHTNGENYLDLPSSPTDPCPPPSLKIMDINVNGVIFTTKLAIHHFRLNNPGEDCHLLLVGSMASFLESNPLMALYSASKHAVLGLFHSIRLNPGVDAPLGFRVNLLCPYFIDTGILPIVAKLILGGVELAKLSDAVDAVLRLSCDRAAQGRCLVITPPKTGGVLEMDWMELKEVEPFTRRTVAILNLSRGVKQRIFWVKDAVRILGPVKVGGVLVLVLAVLVGSVVASFRAIGSLYC